jgi:hypothetical protein
MLALLDPVCVVMIGAVSPDARRVSNRLHPVFRQLALASEFHASVLGVAKKARVLSQRGITNRQKIGYLGGGFIALHDGLLHCTSSILNQFWNVQPVVMVQARVRSDNLWGRRPECCSDFTEKNEHKDYYENDTENPGRAVSPGAAIAPSRKSSYQHKYEKN